MNLHTIAHDLRDTGLEWAEEAASYLDQHTYEYAVLVLVDGEWLYVEIDPFRNSINTYRKPESAPWMENTHHLPHLKKIISRWRPGLETRIVRRPVGEIEVVE